MAESDITQEDARREIRRIRGAVQRAPELKLLLENWPGSDYDPEDPRTYPED